MPEPMTDEEVMEALPKELHKLYFYADACQVEHDEAADTMKLCRLLAEKVRELRDVDRVLSEECPTDELHCGCVPALRREIERLREAIMARVKPCDPTTDYDACSGSCALCHHADLCRALHPEPQEKT